MGKPGSASSFTTEDGADEEVAIVAAAELLLTSPVSHLLVEGGGTKLSASGSRDACVFCCWARMRYSDTDVEIVGASGMLSAWPVLFAEGGRLRSSGTGMKREGLASCSCEGSKGSGTGVSAVDPDSSSSASEK